MPPHVSPLTIEGAIWLLLVAVIVAVVARRLRLPYTVGLVVTGLALSLTAAAPAVTLTRDLVFHALLPPLLFEAALALRLDELRRDAMPLTLLTIGGVLVSAAVVAAGMALLVHWPLPAALVFGVLIAATDPVAVIATFKEMKVTGRLRLLVEAESLFNDGVAALLFTLALAFATSPHGAPGAAGAARELLAASFGGVLIGAACGGLALLLAGRTEDHLVELAVTAVAAYGSFLLADRFGLSGVLATVTAGVLMGNEAAFGRHYVLQLTARGREAVRRFWEFAAFVSNSLVFLLMGLREARIPFHALGAVALAVAIALVLVGRALSVYPLCPLLGRTRWAVPRAQQHVLFWGGLRGALALALSLSLPDEMPYRDQVVIATFGVVAFSVLVQGLTMPLLMARLGLLAGGIGRGAPTVPEGGNV